MNTSQNDYSSRNFPHCFEQRLEEHLENEHDSIRKGLRKLLAMVCAGAPTGNSDEEIAFRNQLIWVSRIMKAHMTSEERVVFKRTYDSLSAHEKKDIDHLCDVNGSIDLILDHLEVQSWKNSDGIRSHVMLLLQLFESHVQYEDGGLAERLQSMPAHSHRFLIRQLVHSKNEFLEWLSSVERPCLPV